MSGKPYPKEEYIVSRAATLLQCSRTRDKMVEVPREQPCNVIVVHGVNDVGTAYSSVEEGLCAGLQDRLLRQFNPARYRLPVEADKKKVFEDPDAVFFKRSVATDTDSPVIPFYWGFREESNLSQTMNGQKTDRNGNRLDKDLSKGGGPFGNATSSLPDMWNRGVWPPFDPAGDPLRPLRTGPGRMYMVLAARRLAALVTMIRQYEPKDTVNIVAHSQGCLVSLLAQAFLLEIGQRTADTLILTHPPYSLDEQMGQLMKVANYFQGDKDAAMAGFYELLDGRQTVNARLQTLINIVTGIAKSKTGEPSFGSLGETECGGMVHDSWKPDGDRDNRGKVYLYFCPEDMTVALDNMRGIGWQGVPDVIDDTRHNPSATAGYAASKASFGVPHLLTTVTRNALSELGPTFRQRVFTAKLRAAPGASTAQPVLVGQPPHDFTLRLAGENDHAHVASSGRTLRESLPATALSSSNSKSSRHGFRKINGEPLKSPYRPDVRGNQVEAGKIPADSEAARAAPDDRGPCEQVDPIDAATALTAKGGVRVRWEILPTSVSKIISHDKPGLVSIAERGRLEAAYNEAKSPNSTNPDDKYRILKAGWMGDGKIEAHVQESPNAARLRWQHEFSPKSFHSVIFASSKNHRHVTAYDLSIGSGKAVSDPTFRAYLCAVADWRLKVLGDGDDPRAGILTINEFVRKFKAYFLCEPTWRAQLIQGNARYYSSGVLPPDLPVLTGKLWDIVVSETTSGMRVTGSASRGAS